VPEGRRTPRQRQDRSGDVAGGFPSKWTRKLSPDRYGTIERVCEPRRLLK
jgi:hypothetical protein